MVSSITTREFWMATFQLRYLKTICPALVSLMTAFVTILSSHYQYIEYNVLAFPCNKLYLTAYYQYLGIFLCFIFHVMKLNTINFVRIALKQNRHCYFKTNWGNRCSWDSKFVRDLYYFYLPQANTLCTILFIYRRIQQNLFHEIICNICKKNNEI